MSVSDTYKICARKIRLLIKGVNEDILCWAQGYPLWIINLDRQLTKFYRERLVYIQPTLDRLGAGMMQLLSFSIFLPKIAFNQYLDSSVAPNPALEEIIVGTAGAMINLFNLIPIYGGQPITKTEEMERFDESLVTELGQIRSLIESSYYNENVLLNAYNQLIQTIQTGTHLFKEI